MLKIIGGKHRGRALEEPQGQAVRPTASRAREALFNIVAHANWHADGTSPLVGARVLDAFAGSGALGLEALSRGAEHATFLDNEARAIKLIGDNIRKLARRRPPAWCAATPPGRRPAASPATWCSSIRPIARASPPRR